MYVTLHPIDMAVWASVMHCFAACVIFTMVFSLQQAECLLEGAQPVSEAEIETYLRSSGQVVALHGHCVRIACNADTMKPSQGGREETTLHLCRRHKGLHILGGWWPWPSAICCCVSVLEDGGSVLGT